MKVDDDFYRQILEQATNSYLELNTIRVHVAQDCTGRIMLLKFGNIFIYK